MATPVRGSRPAATTGRPGPWWWPGSEDGWVAESVRCLRGPRRRARALERRATSPRRLPFLDLAGARFALFTPSGGVLFAERILRDLARPPERARGRAARRTRRCARSIRPAPRSGPPMAASTGRTLLVIAAGPWAPQLLPALAGRVMPSRQVAVYLEPPDDRLRGLAGGADAARSDRGDRGRLLRRAAGRRHRAQGRRPWLLAARRIRTASARRRRTRSPRSWRSPRARLRDFERYRVSAARDLLLRRHRAGAVHRRALRDTPGSSPASPATASSSAR